MTRTSFIPRRRALLISTVLLLCLCQYSESINTPLRRRALRVKGASNNSAKPKKTQDESEQTKVGARIDAEPKSHTKKLTRQAEDYTSYDDLPSDATTKESSSKGYNAARKTSNSDSREGYKIAAGTKQQQTSSNGNKQSSSAKSNEAEKESTKSGTGEEKTVFEAEGGATRAPAPTSQPLRDDDNKKKDKGYQNEPKDHDLKEKTPFTEEQELSAHDEEILDESMQSAPFSLIFDAQPAPEPSDYVDAISVTKESLKSFLFYFYDDALENFALTTTKFGFTSQGPRIDFVAHLKFIDGAEQMTDQQLMDELVKTFSQESFMNNYLKELQGLDSTNPFHKTTTVRFHSDVNHVDKTFVEAKAKISDYQNNTQYGGVVGAFAGAALLLGLSGFIYQRASRSHWNASTTSSSDGIPKDVILGGPEATTSAYKSVLNWLPQYWLEGQEGEETDMEDEEDVDYEEARPGLLCPLASTDKTTPPPMERSNSH